METDAMRVDGNAMAGMLAEVFVREMTATRIACDGCGNVEPVGAEHVYMQAPGIVMRCCHCDSVLLVVAHIGETYRLSLGRSKSLEFADDVTSRALVAGSGDRNPRGDRSLD